MKRRLSASVDEHLLAAAEAAVQEGRAPSMSALVQAGVARELEHQSRLVAMGEFIAAFEEEFGAFEPGEAERLAAELRSKARSAAEILAEEDQQAA